MLDYGACCVRQQREIAEAELAERARLSVGCGSFYRPNPTCR
jgi:hypothetical protein